MLQDAGNTTTAPADGLIKDVTTQTFMKDVIEESKRQPVLAEFWAARCGRGRAAGGRPWKQLPPVLEKAGRAAKRKVKLAKRDIDKHPDMPSQMGIQSIP